MVESADWTDRLSELDEPQTHLVRYLAMEREIYRQMGYWKNGGYHYTGMGDFLLQHGCWYKPIPYRFSYPEGRPKMCFGNAVCMNELYGLRYVEGIAWKDDLPITIHHAWNTNSVHTLIDTTWLNDGAAYLGVEFPVQKVRTALRRGSVLLDNRANKFKLFKTPYR